MSPILGTRLGVFEVLGPLGAGGMGEVYRARDTRLSREVAVKILPAEFSSDAARLKRFEKEALSASSLNHPNIVTIYEIGSESGTSFIAMELVEGRTLRELLSSGPLPAKKLLAIAAQIADGLAKAHSAGIVHRDLKPENVMVTPDGHVKILDFGLAKLTRPDEGSDANQTQTPTVSAGTEAGVVMGTVGYMSPEQASGRHVDFRSDQFSFGSMLYELATGKRAFQRETAPEVLSAIIREEPEPIAALNARVPAPLRWIVERCLAKEPEDRYASTRDLAHELASVREHLSEASFSSGARDVRPADARRRRVAHAALIAWAALATLGAALAVWRLATRRPPTVAYHRMTFRHGNLLSGRFAPDGRTIAYAAAWEGKSAEVFAARVEDAVSRPLGFPTADVLAVSRNGELALSLPKTLPLLWPDAGGTLARAPIDGGAPRSVLDDVYGADFSPDGESLAVVRAVEGVKRLEYPVGKVLDSDVSGAPRVSPDGKRVAYTCTDARGTCVAVVDRAGKRTVLSSGWLGIFGVAWRPAGDEVWFSTSERGTNDTGLYAVDLAGRQRLVTRWLFLLHDIARDGRLLVETGSGRNRMLCLPPGETKERDIAWLDRSVVCDISADGRTVVFTEGGDGVAGKPGVYLRGTDGSPAVRLGDVDPTGSVALSPDGRWVLARSPKERSRLVMLPTGAGEARSIDAKELVLVWMRWFPDGKQILVGGTEAGKGLRFFVQPVNGTQRRPLTPAGMTDARPAISPDGTRVAAPGPDHRIALYPVDGGEPRALAGAELGEEAYVFSADGRWLYVGHPGELPQRVFRIELETGKRELWKELMPADPAGAIGIGRIQITPDARSYAYTSVVVLASNLYVVEGLE